jgi:hypothetical protein
MDEIIIRLTPSEIAVTSGCLINRLILTLNSPEEEFTKRICRAVLDKLEAALIIHIYAAESDQN